jgi:hypothetical protein
VVRGGPGTAAADREPKVTPVGHLVSPTAAQVQEAAEALVLAPMVETRSGTKVALPWQGRPSVAEPSRLRFELDF